MLPQQARAEHRIHGREALEAVGIPLEFAAQIMLLANSLGIAIAIRAGKPFQLYNDHCIPKPSFVKAKTGNWGFAKGVIPENSQLGKIDANGVVVAPPVIPEEVSFTQHKISLGEIVRGLQNIPPEYQLISLDPSLTPEEYIQRHHRLAVVPAAEAAPKNNSVIFSIDLERGSLPLQVDVEPICTTLFKAKHECPSWWDEQWGKFSDRVSYRYPAEYQENISGPLLPLQIYAIRDNQDELIPITGDMDLLWVTRPTQKEIKQRNLSVLPESAHRVVNTAELEGSALMLEALIELHTHFAEQRDEIFDINEISDESIGRAGCITPLESFFITKINERFSKFAPHITNLFQHGAENRNPGLPSDIDGKILHIWQGEVILTESEKDLVDFVLNTPGYLENNIIDVHPKWKMELWAPVINKQILLRQSIHSEVMERYKKYIQTFWTAKDFISHLVLPFLSKAKDNNNDDIIDVIRCQHEGSFFENKCFTARTSLNLLEKVCNIYPGWTLDKVEKCIYVKSETENIVIHLDADHISANSSSIVAMAVLIVVAQALDMVKQKIVVHSPKANNANKFQTVWNEFANPDVRDRSDNLDQMISKIDDIISTSEKMKHDQPVKYYKSFLFANKQPRKLSFCADAKAQRAWLGFFDKKSSDMQPAEKEKFIEAHSRIKEIIKNFDLKM
ncbi:MAG: hypothetical protein P4M12_06930 [Gammaproteobacteria bacterium]|nr:hypothetical protein [Gammaproteobacteria bacterium]